MLFFLPAQKHTPVYAALQFCAAENFCRVAFSALRSRSRIIGVVKRERSRAPPMTIELVPSILSANFARLADDAKAALEGGGSVVARAGMQGQCVAHITLLPPVNTPLS